MTLDSVDVALIYLSIPWVVLEAASRFFQSRSSSRLEIRRNTSKEIRRTWASRGPLWIKIETTALNNTPSSFLYHLQRLWPQSRKQTRQDFRSNGHGPNHAFPHNNGLGDDDPEKNSQFRKALYMFYDAGTIFAGLALIGSVAFLIWGAFDLVGQISQLGRGDGDMTSSKIQKRSVKEVVAPQEKVQSWAPSLVPLIPGLTLPLSHIYPLVLSLSMTQVIHEAGHAICGTLQSWTPLRMGLIFLFPCIPGAFVVLPHEAVDDGKEEEDSDRNEQASLTRKRLRNISAGVWHNAISALLLGLVLFSGIGRGMHQALWKDVSSIRVESVDPSSPLWQHMPTGTLIFQLNDFNMNLSSTSRLSTWEEQLLDGGAERQETLGWCVPRKSWQGQETSCCDLLVNNSTSQEESRQDSLCFQVLGDSPTQPGRCYDPVRLVSTKSDGQRCRGECSKDRLCIVSDKKEELIRITILRSDEQSSRVVLFQGSPSSIYSSLTVSPFQFRIEWIGLPYHIFQWWNLLISYLFNLSLAMALLNMLPLPSLDGDVYLHSVLEALVARFHIMVTHSNDEDLEYDEEGLSGMELGARVTSRPDSPTQLRRPAPAPREASSSPSQLRQSNTGSSHRNLQRANSRVSARIQERFRWFMIFLAAFVFGGSILLHATKEG